MEIRGGERGKEEEYWEVSGVRDTRGSEKKEGFRVISVDMR